MRTKAQQEAKDSYYSTTYLRKKRGWTPGSIKEFLGEPDKIVLKKNPKLNKKPLRTFWDRDKVHKIEALKSWQDWYKKSLKQRQGASERGKAFVRARHKEAEELRLNGGGECEKNSVA